MKKLLLSLFILPTLVQADDLSHTWSHTDTLQTVAIDAKNQHYQGHLKFSALPEHMVSFGWQDSDQQQHVLLHTQQQEVPIYWSVPHNATHLWLKQSQASSQTIQAQLTLKIHTIYPQTDICHHAQPQSAVLQNLQQQLNTQPLAEHAQILNLFWQRIAAQSTPITEPINAQSMRLVYLWRGAKNNVRMIGGASNNHDWLQRLPNSDVWYKEYVVPHDYRGSYVFAVDIPHLQNDGMDGCDRQQAQESRAQRLAILGHLHTDPYNPNTLMASKTTTQRNESVFDAASESHPNTDTVVSSHVQTHVLHSSVLNNQRRISIYQPPNAANTNNLPTLIFLDGESYTESIDVPRLLDEWILTGRIAPVQAIFVHNPSAQARNQELPPNANYVHMIETELLPFLHTHLHTPMSAQNTAIIGSSFGGLAAANLGLSLPRHFSHVVSLSGSFWWQAKHQLPHDKPFVLQRIQHHPPTTLKWFLSANSDETGRNQAGILETTQEVYHSLKIQQQDVIFQQYSGGHNYVVWKKALLDALLHFYPAQNQNISK
ncbi:MULTISPECIES: alpha/beta hydrolase-fold protein [Vitreoscilla]|uniref:DUF3327 domain-containing protein n=1 Tax=Vitreoscilla stercoraria TaxID=61 RepID=A0ABY4E806_VITST|nr:MULTISPECIES: alpha/beta hydrolase-fold protein [Vitreoscilla]AUZ04958.2 putative esterase [Vitreoscilla sp. C1]UOO91399.1 DUF3327 domain-containing protein [Vitreoscilla stercoraria]